jgi:hypothetical protein
MSPGDVASLGTFVNQATNGGAENSKVGWTLSGTGATAANLVVDTTNKFEGNAGLAWTPANANNYLTNAPITITANQGLSGRACAALVATKTTSSLKTLEAYNGSGVLGTVTILPSTNYQPTILNFSCPASGAASIRIGAGDTTIIYVDSLKWGDANGINLTSDDASIVLSQQFDRTGEVMAYAGSCPINTVSTANKVIGLSSGDYIGAKYYNLYTKLWNGLLATSGAGVTISSAAGASAAADWAANKTIRVDFRDLVLRGIGSFNTVIGQYQGDGFGSHNHGGGSHKHVSSLAITGGPFGNTPGNYANVIAGSAYTTTTAAYTSTEAIINTEGGTETRGKNVGVLYCMNYTGVYAAPIVLSGRAPTVTTFTSGSGTYTPPLGVTYLSVKITGGGGGGSGSGISGAGYGGAGGASTFGASLLTANGGGGGLYSNQPSGGGGAGGTASIGSGATGTTVTGGYGNGGAGISGQSPAGGGGGNNPFGGAGGGGSITLPTGYSGAAKTGGGGGGASGSGITYSGSGGGAGGYVDAVVTPQVSFVYNVGAAGAAGSAGSGGAAGGAGGSGYIEVIEHYGN